MSRCQNRGRVILMRKKRKVRKAKPHDPWAKVKIALDSKNMWIVKNFLVPMEKRALMQFYQDRINHIMEATKKDDTKDLEPQCEHDIKRFTERMKFILEHF